MNIKKYINYPIYENKKTILEYLILKSSTIYRCPICGSYFPSIKICGENYRETCLCNHCNSTNRQRQMAVIVCNVLKTKCLNDLAESKLTVYNTESSGVLHKYLSGAQNYTFSEYFGDNYKSGDHVNGIMHQNLTNLSFDSNKFDLVLSSDVMEHIPEPYKAHTEIYRILKPGGRHIFTVPFIQTG